MGYGNPEATYYMNNSPLANVTEEKDLGVVVHSSLKLSRQCAEAAKKANRVLGIINVCFTDRSKQTILPLYTSVITSPTSLRLCSPGLESVFSKGHTAHRVGPAQSYNIGERTRTRANHYRLSKLNLMTLDKRRERADLIEAFKLIHSITQIYLMSLSQEGTV
jgi:hypothetical protein